MSYEGSEIATAAALELTKSELEAIQRAPTVQKLQKLLKDNNTARKLPNVKFGDSAAEIGFLKRMDPTIPASIKDMAVGISAAIAIRTYIKSTTATITVYMTGNVWPKEVQDFQVNAYGFKDYNSSDIIVQKSSNKNIFYGISLKKKNSVKASDPTLINKTFSSTFDGKEFDDLKKELVDTRIEYFSDIVIEAVDKGIIQERDIPDFARHKRGTMKSNKSGKEELYYAKAKSKVQFGKYAYIDTKGWATAGGPTPYLTDKTDDPKSMRYFVNRKLGQKTKNPLWLKVQELLDRGSLKLARNLINIILKRYLFDKIDAKKIEDKEFDFALITGIADVTPKGTVKILPATVTPLKTTLCGLTRIQKKYRGAYKVVQDTETTNSSNAAKLVYKLMRGTLPVLDLEIRYKGSFTPKPQFQGGMTKEFKAILDTETCG